MITFIYPKEDWTAAELAMKVRGLAGSRNLRVYSTPKHGRRDDEMVYRKLRKTTYAVFLAYDQIYIDNDTEKELRFIKKHKIPIYFIVPENMNGKIRELGFGDNIYPYQLGNIDQLRETLNEILMKQVAKKAGSDDFWGLIILLGLLLFSVFLVAGAAAGAGNEG